MVKAQDIYIYSLLLPIGYMEMFFIMKPNDVALEKC
jgi:hypothetical protein